MTGSVQRTYQPRIWTNRGITVVSSIVCVSGTPGSSCGRFTILNPVTANIHRRSSLSACRKHYCSALRGDSLTCYQLFNKLCFLIYNYSECPMLNVLLRVMHEIFCYAMSRSCTSDTSDLSNTTCRTHTQLLIHVYLNVSSIRDQTHNC